MTTFELRRSSRLNTQDPNGRDYLSSLMGWSRYELECWITSPTVRPHLRLWYRLCITSQRRFNDAVEWINTGPKGYFYNERDLQEDLLLYCMCEGDDEASGGVRSAYGDETLKTGKWITQELWARTAWRIVHANKGPGQAFEKNVVEHPAACYAFVVDLLCMAFHSIAHRGKASCYEGLINGTVRPRRRNAISDPILEEAANDEDTESVTSISTIGVSTETSDNSMDLDFDDSSSVTSATSEMSVKYERKVDDNYTAAQVFRVLLDAQKVASWPRGDGGMAK